MATPSIDDRERYIRHLEDSVISLRHEKNQLMELYMRAINPLAPSESTHHIHSEDKLPTPVGGRKSWNEKRAELEAMDRQKAIDKGLIKGS